MFSVKWLEVASQIVRLASGIMLEGIINGKVVIANVINTQAIVNEDVKNTQPFLSLPDKIIVNIGITIASNGIAQSIGSTLKLFNQEVSVVTLLNSGLESA